MCLTSCELQIIGEGMKKLTLELVTLQRLNREGSDSCLSGHFEFRSIILRTYIQKLALYDKMQDAPMTYSSPKHHGMAFRCQKNMHVYIVVLID